jgi:hypothetical protein
VFNGIVASCSSSLSIGGTFEVDISNADGLKYNYKGLRRMLPRKVSHNQLESWIEQIVADKTFELTDLDKNISKDLLKRYQVGVRHGARELISTLVLHGIIEREY